MCALNWHSPTYTGRNHINVKPTTKHSIRLVIWIGIVEKKPYQCKSWSKAFTLTGKLKQRSFAHTREKPYLCKICSKAVTWADELNWHSLTHTEEKPYQCKICRKMFSQPGKLKQHSLAQTGEKPYQCEISSKALVQPGKLKHTLGRNHTDTVSVIKLSLRLSTSIHWTYILLSHTSSRFSMRPLWIILYFLTRAIFSSAHHTHLHSYINITD